MRFRQDSNINCKYVQIMRMFLVLLCVILLPITLVYSQQGKSILFSYEYQNSDEYRIEANNLQTIYVNKKLYEDELIINTNILLEILSRNTNGFEIDYQVETIENGQLILSQDSKFTQYRNGFMIVPKEFEVPFIRNIPQLPLIPIKVGYEWTSLGQDNILLPEANSYTLINVDVHYKYLGFHPLPDEVLQNISERIFANETQLLTIAPMISADYSIHDRIFFNPNINEYQKINSSYEMNIWWNHEDNRMEYYEEEYNIQISYANGDEVVFSGKANAFMIGVTKLDKSIDNLQKEIDELVDDVEVTSHEKGITLSIQNIQFEADSSILRKEEITKLDALANILLRYKNRRFLIEGHTALAGLQKDREILSAERAKNVLQYLQQRTGLGETQFLYRGKGAENPISSNYTEEGRAKNRRVEIIILEN